MERYQLSHERARAESELAGLRERCYALERHLANIDIRSQTLQRYLEQIETQRDPDSSQAFILEY